MTAFLIVGVVCLVAACVFYWFNTNTPLQTPFPIILGPIGAACFLIAVGMMLTACGGDGPSYKAPPSSGWAIGAPEAKSTPATFTIPERGSVNYVTRSTGSLEGKTRITLRYRVDMAEGVRIFPPSMPDGPSIITLYLQRKGDDWSGRGEMNFYRWYATSRSVMPIAAGEHTLTASLDSDKWTAVNAGESITDVPNAGIIRNTRFDAALKNASRVGFVLGGGTGFGHGVSATGPATFTIISFTVE